MDDTLGEMIGKIVVLKKNGTREFCIGTLRHLYSDKGMKTNYNVGCASVYADEEILSDIDDYINELGLCRLEQFEEQKKHKEILQEYIAAKTEYERYLTLVKETSTPVSLGIETFMQCIDAVKRYAEALDRKNSVSWCAK